MQKTSFFSNSFSTEASKSFIVWKSIPLFFIINLQKEWEKQGIRRMSWENSARLSVNFARFARYRALLNTVQLRPINPNILPLQTKPFPEWFDISFLLTLCKYEKMRIFSPWLYSLSSESRKYFMILIKIIDPFLFPWGLKWNSIAFHQIWKWNIKLSIATISLLQTQFIEQQSFVKQYSIITILR